MSDSDISRKIIIYTTYIIILYIIIEELYILTSFVYSYNSAYDYGLMLRNMCNNEYFEYETERFQLYNDIYKLRITNDTYNKKNYIIVILIISVIVALIISFVFANLFYHNFIEDFKYCTKFDSGDKQTYSTLKQVILCFCPMCGDLSDCTLSYIVYMFLLIFIPLYLILKFGLNKDFDLFTNNPFKKYLIVFIVSLFIFRLPIKYFDRIRFVNPNSSLFIYYLYLIIYIMIFYYICNIIKYYNDFMFSYNNILNEKDELDNVLTEEDKFYKYCNKEIVEGHIDNPELNIFKDIVANFFGFKGLGNNDIPLLDDSGVFIKDISRYIFIIGVVLVIVYILYLAIFKFKLITSLITSDNDYKLIYNKIILPLFTLFIILLITNSTSLYNSYINKYVLYNPLNLYKYDLDKLNKSFDTIVINDRSTLNDPKAVCLKISNAILTVLYSNLFKYNFATGMINDIEDPRHFTLNITPKFNYKDDDCATNTDYNKNYNEDPLYNIKNIILPNNNSIFYNANNTVNNDVFRYILMNVFPNLNYTDTLSENDFLIYLDDIKMNIKAAIANVMVLSKNPSGKLSMDDINFNKLNNSDFYINNKNRENDIYLYNNDNKYSKVLISYDKLINDISKEYIKLMSNTYYLVIEMMSKIEKCEKNNIPTSDNSIINRLKSDLEKANDDIKGVYITKFTSYIKITFDNINKLLSSYQTDRNEYTLTKYIISNYNNVNLEKIYNKSDFISIATPEKIKYDEEHFHELDAAKSLVTTKKISLDTATAAYNNASPKTGEVAVQLQTAVRELQEAEDALNLLYKPIQPIASDDPMFGDEKRANIICANANTTSLSIIVVYIIYLFVLLEPFYIESFDNN